LRDRAAKFPVRRDDAFNKAAREEAGAGEARSLRRPEGRESQLRRERAGVAECGAGDVA
jgi:hypothetical protein